MGQTTAGVGVNGGGNGTTSSSGTATSGAVNTGGGGGGDRTSVAGSGGSGVVIVRYLGGQVATGGTITSSGGYTVHTFTGVGTFTFTV